MLNTGSVVQQKDFNTWCIKVIKADQMFFFFIIERNELWNNLMFGVVTLGMLCSKRQSISSCDSAVYEEASSASIL
ncbi:unnamed protein product [Ilex paraguariensis]|uniref:Uncharacterized protein n=1 Tax=Ilex paraguariensis TaxID=185542 RepID=A0ABC8UK15_9AQUA